MKSEMSNSELVSQYSMRKQLRRFIRRCDLRNFGRASSCFPMRNRSN